MPGPRTMLALTGGLGLAVACLYLPTVGFSFLPLDDAAYVTANPHLGDGLGWSTFAWAWTSTYFGWWHPMTWLSHLLDVSLYGDWAGGHHLTSALLHAANAVLLVIVLRRFGVDPWRALLVSALVMLHPTRVETVAWIAERKDVLSETLLLLACVAWQHHRQRPSPLRYLLVCAVFALALTAKTMVVTFPVLLLVVDVWTGRKERWSRLVLEKVPLVALAGLAGLSTVWAQHRVGAMAPAATGLGERLAGVPLAWWWYLRNTVWPNELCPYYERTELAPGPAVAAALGVAVVAVLLWRFRARTRHLAAGLSFFVIALGPVVGVLQVGGQAIADRYLYLPHMGLFAGLVLSVPSSWISRFGLAVRAGVICVLAGLAGLSLLQLDVWRSADTLYPTMAACAPDSIFVRSSVALWHLASGRPREGLELATDVARVDTYGRAVYGLALLENGSDEEGLRVVEQARRAAPGDHNVLQVWESTYLRAGSLAGQRGEYERAVSLFEQVVSTVPQSAPAHRLLAAAQADLRLGARPPGAVGGPGAADAGSDPR